MATKSGIDSDLIEEIERKYGLEPGDFGFALDTFWLMMKHLMVSKVGFVIYIYKFGFFGPSYYLLDKAIKKNIRRIKKGIGNKEKLYYLLQLRRKMIKRGEAPKTYYLKKEILHGGEDDRRRAERALEVLRDRCQRLNKAVAERKDKERRARRDRIR